MKKFLIISFTLISLCTSCAGNHYLLCTSDAVYEYDRPTGSYRLVWSVTLQGKHLQADSLQNDTILINNTPR